MIAALSSGAVETGLWVVFFAALALAVCLGLILAYHWFVHAHNTVMSALALAIYIAVSFLLLSAMAGALLIA